LIRLRRFAAKNFLNLAMQTVRIPPVELAVATIAAVLVKHDGHMRKLLGDLKVAPT
jgi:hypothetical protein